MKVAILTRPDNKSPKNLAITLSKALEKIDVNSEIFYDIDFLTRMIPLQTNLRWKLKLHYRICQKLKFYFKDLKLLKKLRGFQAIIVCECIPNAMWSNVYPIKVLKSKLEIPVGLYEVFFLDSAPHFIENLKAEYNNFKNPYDFELAISSLSYTRINKKKNQFEIGLNLFAQGLGPRDKKELTALIDFEWEGEKKYIIEQKKILNELGIKYIELKGSYSIEEIREIYSECSIFFLQHFESFGLPIAENLSYGNKIFTAHSGWPMAFRLNDQAKIYGKGKLADCFTIYNDENDLRQKLIEFKESFIKNHTPNKVFDNFLSIYSRFYKGDINELKEMVSFVDHFNQN